MTENSSDLTPKGVNETLTWIEVDKIGSGRFQYRQIPLDLKELEESIKAQGLIEPVLVRLLSSGQFELVCGHSRLQAHKNLGRTTIKAIAKELSDDQAEDQAFTDNHQRNNHSWQEEARYYKRRMTKTGLSERELAKRLGISYKVIQERVQRYNQLEERGLQDTKVPLSKVPDLLGLKNPRAGSQPEGGEQSYLWPIRMPLDIHEKLGKLPRQRAEETVVTATRLYFEHGGQSRKTRRGAE